VSVRDPIQPQPNRRSAERRQADRALRESEERYRALFDRSLDCVYLHDFEGRFLDANPATLDLLGYGHEELLAISFLSLLDDGQLAKALGILAELKETGVQQRPTEYRLRRKTGEYVDVETKASVIFRDGLPYAVQGTARDITELRQTETGLEEARQQLAVTRQSEQETLAYAESLVDTVREPLIALDEDLRVVTASRSFYEVFKVRPEETIGRLIYDLGNMQWDIPELRELLETILPQRTTFDNYEV